MDKKVLKGILNRLNKLEERVFKQDSYVSRPSKTKTLSEIIKDKKFKNGQEKVTVIIGYYEKIEKKTDITESDIKKGWIKGKLDGKHRSNLLERAVGDGLVRDLEAGAYDLTQTGEDFFEKFLKNEHTKTTS